MPSFMKQKDTYKLVGEQRKSKIVGDAGCGALVEFPGFSGIMGGQNLWPTPGLNLLRIHERNLEEKLHRKYFIQVSTDETGEKLKSNVYRLPIIRFPDYYYCPNCHELDYAKNIAKNLKSDKKIIEPLLCNKCGNVELIPSRFVLACEDGHIEDFPYNWWVHKGAECKKPRLMLKYVGKTGGLDSIEVSCETCHRKATMANVLNKEATVMLKCQGKSPWLGTMPSCKCGKPVRALLRGSSNIYYPEQDSALTIPPWSNIIQKYIDDNYDTLNAFFIVAAINNEMKKIAITEIFNNNNLAKDLHCNCEDFIEQVFMRLDSSYKAENKKINLKQDEYLAFTGPDKDDYFFKTEKADIADELKPYFSCIKLVKRLREVKVLKSFRRITAYDEEGGSLSSAPISTKFEEWLPAAELLGEGIFIEFSKEKLQNWAKKIGNRYDKMEIRYKKAKLSSIHHCGFSPYLVALHTFSHLLMREFSFTCGYDAAALAERLYISDDSDENWMAGVLIYTATTCSDGSLGGLVRQGEADRLKDTILSMLNRASWCSNDPICIDSKSQGNNSLNYAACHACTLISEISCCFNNTVLDRYSIVGDITDRKLGYLGDLV